MPVMYTFTPFFQCMLACLHEVEESSKEEFANLVMVRFCTRTDRDTLIVEISPIVFWTFIKRLLVQLFTGVRERTLARTQPSLTTARWCRVRLQWLWRKLLAGRRSALQHDNVLRGTRRQTEWPLGSPSRVLTTGGRAWVMSSCAASFLFVCLFGWIKPGQ